MALARYLLDTSAHARLMHPAVADVLAPLLERRLVGTCGLTDLEAMHSVRSAAELDEIAAERALVFEWLEIEDRDFVIALGTQAELARRGRHRAASIPDLVIAAVAARHRVAVLHYDADYEMIAEVTGQAVQWVVPRGSVP